MEGTAAYSLAGYLSLKPVGALSLVVPTRRYWCAFNETVDTLDFFHSERDLINDRRKALDRISLARSAISLSTTEERVFIILTSNKEYHLQAENHEALMVWLLGLQNKRDASSTAKQSPSLDADSICHTYSNNEERCTSRSNSLNQPSANAEIMERSNLSDFSSEDEKHRRDSLLDPLDRKLSSTSNTSVQLCEPCSTSLCTNCRTLLSRPVDTTQKEMPVHRTGSSSRSIESTDSAFSDQRLPDRAESLQDALITLKCELDSLLNRENVYQTIIKEKSENIRQLEHHLSEIGQLSTTSSKNNAIRKVFDERCRETNNELKFLHCEINRLSRIICDDDVKMRKLIQTLRTQEAQRESLQRDYLYLLQSALSGEDGHLFGGKKHRDRLKQLLVECRQRDPSLPSFDSLEGPGLYIDSYGFKHEKRDEQDRLKYICVKLIHFHDSKKQCTDDQRWRTLLESFRTSPSVPKALKQSVRQGIPCHLRPEFWHSFIHKKVREIRKAKGPTYFQNLCHLLPKSDLSYKFEKQIALDLNRTMPMNVRFTSNNVEGIRQLRQVLQVFCLHNPTIGYCQGMNFIVAVALLILDAEDAFWLLVAITECHLTDYYDSHLMGAQVDQYVLKDLLEQKAPDIYQHFEKYEVEITSLTFNWFMAVFIDSVPFESLLRIWDCFLLEGAKVLFRLALAILILNRENILLRTDTISMIKQIKDSTKSCIDIDTLFKIAFEDLKPFCHRKDIAIKQAYWTKILSDKEIKRRISREGYLQQHLRISDIVQPSVILDCAVVLPGNLVWIAFGTQFTMHLFEVNVERGVMIDLAMTYNSRAFSMAYAKEKLVLVGTLCGALLGFSLDERKLQWTLPLRHCLLCMASVERGEYQRIYCGLSDGNLTMIDLYDQQDPKEVFCISIDPSPIVAVTIHRDQLWCLTSTKITVLNEKTYDILSYIHLTERSIDCPTVISAQEDYIWILLRSKGNTLQAWHPSLHQLHATICLNKVFDRMGRPVEQLAAMKEINPLESNDDEDENTSYAMNEVSISSFLIHDTQLWIGTTMGILYVFEYSFTLKTVASSPRSLCRSYLAHLSPEKSLPRRSLSLTYEPNPSVDCPQKSRSQSDLCHSPLLDCLLTPVLFDLNLWRRNAQMHSTDSVTTLTSVRTRSSSSAILSTDDSDQPSRALKHRRSRSTATSASAALGLNLIFKAKIADTPVKCICQTKCNDQTIILTCSGRLGDDEVACRWRRIPNTNQWTNDVIVELSAETMLPIRPLYARQQYLKDQRDRSVSMSSNASKS